MAGQLRLDVVGIHVDGGFMASSILFVLTPKLGPYRTVIVIKTILNVGNYF